ncbi:MAG TPA: SRPBCC family protein [Candidatus Nanopelagicaceae bacterium]|nr:SRPBCC family protein [Candidatus Nanopelagicaceae bacterium]
MLITQTVDVGQPLAMVWDFFGDIPQVAACLPGANLTKEVGENQYEGDVVIKAGPVKLEFAGAAEIKDRNESTKTLQVAASGSDKKGRGAASMVLTAALTPAGSGTKVKISLDLQISGAAAQYGRGMVSDVTAVLISQFAATMQSRLTAISQGLDPNQVAGPKPASGLMLGLQATGMALKRVFNRFFLPYKPQPSR